MTFDIPQGQPADVEAAFRKIRAKIAAPATAAPTRAQDQALLNTVKSLQAQVAALSSAGSSATTIPPIVESLQYVGTFSAPVAVTETAVGQVTPGLPPIGVALSASSGIAKVTTFGDATYPGWSWTPEAPVYVADDGTLSQTVGTWEIGQAVSATTIRVQPLPVTQDTLLDLISVPSGTEVDVPAQAFLDVMPGVRLDGLVKLDGPMIMRPTARPLPSITHVYASGLYIPPHMNQLVPASVDFHLDGDVVIDGNLVNV